MRKVARSPILQVLAALVVGSAIVLSAGSSDGKIIKKPKKTKPETQQGVVTRVVDKIVPGGAAVYREAAQNPAALPRYEAPAVYQNPMVRGLEFRDSSALQEARRWLSDPTVAPDHAAIRASDQTLRRSSGTNFFTHPAVVPATPEDAHKIVNDYGSVPTGIVVEGQASGIGTVDDVQYDPILNAFVLNDRSVYFSPIAPQNLAALCRAIAADPRIGVALGPTEIAYGALPHQSQVAVDLKLTDNFLGNITFAQADWLPETYPFANGYALEPDPKSANTAVSFKIKDFQFQITQEVVRARGANFEIRLIPLTTEAASDGGALPDYDAISRGVSSPQFERNADHIARNIDYYRRETYVDNAFRHGEVSAFLRSLQDEDVDLIELAALVEQSTGVGALPSTPPVADMQAPINQLFTAWKTIDLPLYLAQWSPAGVQIGPTRSSTFADIQASRTRLFARVSASAAANTTIFLGYDRGIGIFRNQYILEYRTSDDELHSGSACETYKVRYEGGHWVIIENREDASC